MGRFSDYYYHHDNNEDGDTVIAESYCGVGRVGRQCGIFHDNDQVYINNECCSPALTTDMIPFIYYHAIVASSGTVPIFGVCSYDYVNDYTNAGIFPSTIVGSWEYTDCRGSPSI